MAEGLRSRTVWLALVIAGVLGVVSLAYEFVSWITWQQAAMLLGGATVVALLLWHQQIRKTHRLERELRRRGDAVQD